MEVRWEDGMKQMTQTGGGGVSSSFCDRWRNCEQGFKVWMETANNCKQLQTLHDPNIQPWALIPEVQPLKNTLI